MALSNSASGQDRTMTLGVANAITIKWTEQLLTVERSADGVKYFVVDRSNFKRFINDLYTAFDEETA